MFCPQCGAQNPPHAVFCGACGLPFPERRPHAAGKLEGAPPSSAVAPSAQEPASDAPNAARPANVKQTMLGMPSPLAPNPAPAAPAVTPKQAMAQTMLGVAPVMPPTNGGAAPQGQTKPMAPQPPAQTKPMEPMPPATSGLGSAKKTMIGVALPGVAPASPAAAAPSAPAAAPKRANQTLLGIAGPQPGAPARGKNQTLVMPAARLPGGSTGTKRTLIGMISPFAPAEPEFIEEEYDEVVPETGEVERRVRLVAKPPPPLTKRPGFYVVLAAGALLVGGVVVALLVRSAPPLRVEARVDAAGKDTLHVTCAGCPDGTTLTGPGGGKGTVKGGEADIPTTTPLVIGDNPVSIAIDRPGAGRDESVTVDVAVGYRIWPELEALQDTPPSVRVRVEALPGSAVTVQGKSVALDEAGRGISKVDVSDALEGLASEVKTLDREIAYTVAPKGGAPETGKLAVKIGITTLVLDAPGPRMVTDAATFLLAGKTSKGGGLVVGEKAPLKVNPDGSFEQLMNISSVGTTEVPLRASAPALAPRLAKITVKRVASLAAEAKELDAQGRPGFGDVQAKGEGATGTDVAWHGEVVQSSTQSHQTIAMIEVVTGCTKKPCRARVVAPGGPTLASGDKIAVYGRVGGLVPFGDAKLPNVDADFVTKGP